MEPLENIVCNGKADSTLTTATAIKNWGYFPPLPTYSEKAMHFPG